MAGSVNKVILVGNLGADPESRTLNNGGEVVNLRVATTESWKDQSGQRQDRTEWHRVVIFNENLGRVAKQYLRKGSKLYLEGQIQTRKWTDQSGTEKFSTEIVLQRFRGELVLLDSRGGGAGGGGGDYSGGDNYGSSGSSSGGNFGGSSGGFGGGQNRDSGQKTGGGFGNSGPFDSDLDDDVPF